MEFVFLGGIAVLVGDGALDLGPARQRCVLVALAVDAGRVVSVDRLIDRVWGESPPLRARATLLNYLSRLRLLLAGAGAGVVTVVRRPGGYSLQAERSAVDLLHFHDLCDRARAVDDGQAMVLLRQALELWRGEALTGVDGEWAEAERDRLHQQRLDAECDLTDVLLRLGHGEDLVATLTTRAAQSSFDERVVGQLVLALYRAGRTADALAHYRQLRDRLIEQLGTEPGTRLQDLHQRILDTDPALTPPSAAITEATINSGTAPKAEDPVPRQLPAPPRWSTGRRTALTRLDQALTAEPDENPLPAPPRSVPAPPAAAPSTGDSRDPSLRVPRQLPPEATDFTGREELVCELAGVLTCEHTGPVVAALIGPGGVGKSALAVHMAHQMSQAYPDGQLHVDLRGTSGAPASPAEVLGRLLRALQSDAIPDEADERMDAYRTVLFNRRVLIVLDDAANEQQVRPLLPGTDSCAVLLTSRNRLAGLAGARHVEVDMLTSGEAAALLAKVAGADRIGDAPDATRTILASCGNLPLAVRIAGARLATRKHWTPRLLAARLTDERRRLDELSAGDQQIRASIEMSVRSLEPAAQSAIRRLGHLGVADFPTWVVAYALDVSINEAEQVVEHLVDNHLVDYTFVDDAGQVRYRLHDLVRIYAREEAERRESDADLVASTARVAGGWAAVLELLRAHVVDSVTSGAIHPHEPIPAGITAADPDVVGTALADPRRWLDVEQTPLVLAVERSAEMGLHELAVAMASVLCASSYALNRVEDLWERVHRAALRAARTAGNAHGEAVLMAELGQLRYEQDRFAEARLHLTDAVERFRDLHDPRGEVSALSALGLACREQGYLPEAEHFLAKASQVCGNLSDDSATGHCQRLIGSVFLERGNFDAAVAALDTALAAYRRAGSGRGEALTLRTIGLTHRACGRLDAAESAFAAALVLFRGLGDAKLVQFCRRGLAKTYVRQGRFAEAREPLDTALVAHRAERDSWSEAMVMRTLGELELACGNVDKAGSWLTGALEIFRNMEATLFCARTLRDIAQVELARGDQTAAEAALAEALETFHAHGAREYDELTGGRATKTPL